MNNLNVYKLDAHTLRIFLKVCELQSVSRAAEHFDLNQSTVSNLLERLRQMLGYKLFEKAGRNIVPTENAKNLIPRAARIVSAIEGLPETGIYDPLEDTRPISIAANLNSMMGALQTIRDAIWAINPDRHVHFVEMGSRDQMEGVLESGTADVLIAVRVAKYPPALQSQSLFRDQSVAFYDAEVRTAPDTTEAYFSARHGVLDFGGYVRSSVANELKRLEGHRNIVCSASNASVLAEMMRGTDLISSMPSRLRHDVFKGFSYCALPLLSNVQLEFDLLWHKRNSDSSRHKWLLGIIQSLDLTQDQ
ncbi:LysR family transcriptional regulator [Cognatishimia sp. WU-CL00825]|uniref:LysR family transcriptional regulator n=1 Tax=Cognatishimia sp. WU-CL00825 TaxID=3127658 RepID=UPI00310B0C07